MQALCSGTSEGLACIRQLSVLLNPALYDDLLTPLYFSMQI